GIGPPRAMHPELLAAEALGRDLQNLLHRKPVGLALPADKAGAVIFKNELVARHWDQALGSTVPGGSAKPRRNASASTGPRPGRCSFKSSSAPSPQAITGVASSTVPGTPLPSAGAAA